MGKKPQNSKTGTTELVDSQGSTAFAILPYLQLDGPLIIDQFTFEPYSADKHTLGPIPSIFFDRMGNRVQSPTVVVLGEVKVEEEFSKLAKRLDQAVTILGFLVLRRRQRSRRSQYTYACAENFQQEIFESKIGSDGDLVSRNEDGLTEMFSASTRHEYAPHYLHVISVKAGEIENERLLGPLVNCIDVKENVLASLKWFNLSFSYGLGFNPSIKILYRCISFEALLELPETEITKEFCAQIKRLTIDDERVGRWADKFYDKRSTVVHSGGTVKLSLSEKGKEYGSELYLSCLIFCVALENKLSEMEMPLEDPEWPGFTSVDHDKYEIEKSLHSNAERLKELEAISLAPTLVDANSGNDFRTMLSNISRDEISPDLDQFVRTILRLKNNTIKFIHHIRSNYELSEEDQKILDSLQSRLTAIKSEDDFSELGRIYEEYVIRRAFRGPVSEDGGIEGYFNVLNNIYPYYAIDDFLSSLDTLQNLYIYKKLEDKK